MVLIPQMGVRIFCFQETQTRLQISNHVTGRLHSYFMENLMVTTSVHHHFRFSMIGFPAVASQLVKNPPGNIQVLMTILLVVMVITRDIQMLTSLSTVGHLPRIHQVLLVPLHLLPLLRAHLHHQLLLHLLRLLHRLLV